jgi:hypothetical protein
MIHAAVGPESPKRKSSPKSKVHIYYDIHTTEVITIPYTPDFMNNKKTWIIQVSGANRNHGDCCTYKFRNVCIVSNLGNFLENCKTYGRSALRIKMYV